MQVFIRRNFLVCSSPSVPEDVFQQNAKPSYGPRLHRAPQQQVEFRGTIVGDFSLNKLYFSLFLAIVEFFKISKITRK